MLQKHPEYYSVIERIIEPVGIHMFVFYSFRPLYTRKHDSILHIWAKVWPEEGKPASIILGQLQNTWNLSNPVSLLVKHWFSGEGTIA